MYSLFQCVLDDASKPKEACDSNHFRCNKTLACIPVSWRCDGDDDCNKDENIHDTSDEENCRKSQTLL